MSRPRKYNSEEYRKGYQAGFEKGKRSVRTNHLNNIADLQLIRHGHWVGIDDFPHDEWECDQCGIATDCYTNYCPNCGAKMGAINED